MGIFSWLTGSAKNDESKDAGKDWLQITKDFKCGKTTSFQLGNFHLAIDKVKNLIILNHSIGMHPHEFAWCQYTATTYSKGGGGGSVQTITTSNGGIGSVYIPGPYIPSSSYTTCQRVKIIRLTEPQDRFLAELERVDDKLCSSVMPYRHIKEFVKNIDIDAMVLGDSGGKVECIAEIDMKYQNVFSKDFFSAVGEWCYENSKNYYRDRAQIELGEICVKAGLNENHFKLASGEWHFHFAAMEDGIAVDRSGKIFVLTNYGAETWTGTLKGGFAKIVDLSTANEKKYKLDVKVDDPAYRAENMTERHFVILGGQPYEVLAEWEERINLLAKNAAAA